MAIYNTLSNSWLINLNGYDIELKLTELINFPDVIKYDLDNTPTNEHLINLDKIINNIYEPCCKKYNIKIPILPSYKTFQVNDILGGDKSSKHLLGYAIDLDVKLLYRDISNKDLFDFIYKELYYDELIWVFGDEYEPNYVHISYIENNNIGSTLRIRNLYSGYEIYN